MPPRPPLPRSPLLEAWSILATPAATPAEAAAKATIEEVASAYLRHRGATQRFSPTCGIGGVRPAPMPPSDGPPSQETPLTQLAMWINPGYWAKAKEPWNVQVRDKGGPANDEDWTDIGIEGGNSGDLTIWPGSKLMPSQRAGAKKGEMDEEITFGPGNTICMKVFGKQLVNLATNHFNFWMPFAFDYLVAPFMGVLFYCSMKGEAWFPACMERVYLGTQPPPWTPGSDPWAAIAPPDAKSNVGPVAITLGSAALSMLASV